MAMEKENAMLSDEELEMATGGALTAFFKKREDGRFDVSIVSSSGDKVGGRMGVREDGVDAMMDRMKTQYPGMTFEWVR